MSRAKVIVLSVVRQGLSKAEAARRYGVSWRWVHTLVTRYESEGMDALEPLSRRPVTNSRATPPQVRQRIIELRTILTSQGLDAGTGEWRTAVGGPLTSWRTPAPLAHRADQTRTVPVNLTRSGSSLLLMALLLSDSGESSVGRRPGLRRPHSRGHRPGQDKRRPHRHNPDVGIKPVHRHRGGGQVFAQSLAERRRGVDRHGFDSVAPPLGSRCQPGPDPDRVAAVDHPPTLGRW